MRDSYLKMVSLAVIGFLFTVLLPASAWPDSESNEPVTPSGSETSLQDKNTLFDFTRTDTRSNFSGTLGYRSDDLNWNIAGDVSGNNPNILSELEWEDLSIFQIKGASTAVYRGIYFKGALAYGWIYSGDVQDSDYLGDDRGLEFSRSNNSADDGNTFDASAGIGYQFLFQSGFIGISPLIGYSYHEQNLTMTDGNQTVASPLSPPVGPFQGLNSTYDTQWKGPWIGVDLSFVSPAYHHAKDRPDAKDQNRYELILGIEYHWADYDAEADWNLRTDFMHPKSFKQGADGTGVLVSGEFSFFFNRCWALNFSGSYQTWETDPGVDRTFFTDGTVSETRLNEVNWNSYALMLGLVYSFQ